MSEITPPDIRNARGKFPNTQWSLVLEASGGVTDGDPHAALTSLCQTYWYPLYAFVRGSGKSYHDAQDIVQGFFERILGQDTLGVADRERGKFRTFLLTAVKNYMTSQHRREVAEKRGGRAELMGVDLEEAEKLYKTETSGNAATPDAIFQRRWALTVIEHALQVMEERYRAKGADAEFAILKSFLTNHGQGTGHEESAASLGITSETLRVRIYRIRRRFRQILRQEIRKTVGKDEEIDDELHYLLAAISG